MDFATDFAWAGISRPIESSAAAAAAVGDPACVALLCFATAQVRARDATHSAVTVSWIGPVSDGGSAVTAYEIHASSSTTAGAGLGMGAWELVGVRLALHPPHVQQVEPPTDGRIAVYRQMHIYIYIYLYAYIDAPIGV
jgi:hypothetical protein